MKQKRLSIIIPTLNEAGNIRELVERVNSAMESGNIIYEIIFIDDNSTDNTGDIVKQLRSRYPLYFFTKKGKKGKAHSLLEGFACADYDVVAILDADLQYPPEALSDMILKIENGFDVVVAKRARQSVSFSRKLLNFGFSLFFSKILHKFDCDVQSGMKIFKRKIIEEIKINPSPWTFDLEFLLKARFYGYKIGSADVSFVQRRSGRSKIIFHKAIYEIGINAIKMKFKKLQPLFLAPEGNSSMIGAGIAYNKKRFITHTTLNHKISAVYTFIPWQRNFIVAVLAISLIGLFLNPFSTGVAAVSVLSAAYFIDMFFNFYLIQKSLRDPLEIRSSVKEIKALNNSGLPVYSILCPLYKEAHMLPVFVRSISKIDWPSDKLDVLLLLEEDDEESIAAAGKMNLPDCFRILKVPFSLPKTKPKACNYGLSLAKGEYIVIYDAEDIPDPLQLKKAYLGFQKAPDSARCLQAKLNYFNPEQNLLTKLFAIEYSLWFDVILPGLQSINTSIPLGGTSNHFRKRDLLELEGWDPFNVTEDCDLGMRIFNKGGRTAIIDSVTLEEANSNLKNWLRQRSRWIKGYIQTYLVHMRNPVSFFRKNGIHAFIFQFVVGAKIIFVFINPVLWMITFSYFALYVFVGPAIEKIYPPLIFYIGTVSLVFGNFLCFYYYMIGCAKREQWSFVKYVFLVPFYWFLMSAAAVIAGCQLFIKPHYWEKTHHGFHLLKIAKKQAVKKQKTKEESGGEFGYSQRKKGYAWIQSRFMLKKIPDFYPRINFSFFKKLSFSAFAEGVFIIPFLKRNFVDFLDVFFGKLPQSQSLKAGGKSILIFNWRDTRHKFAGGAELYTQQIAEEWAKDGNRVTVFCGNDSFSPRSEIINNVEIIRRGGFYFVYIWAFLYYIFRFKGKYDAIIDCQNGIPFFTPLYSRKPVYCLMHHVHQDVFRKSLNKSLAVLASFMEKNAMPLVYGNTVFITVSSSSREKISELGLGRAGIYVINPGVNLEKLRIGDKNEKPLALYLGRLKAYKSIEVLIKAFKLVLKESPEASLVIAGDGEEGENLKNLADKLGINKNKIRFAGKVSEKEKVSLLQKAWVLANPSMMEGWGIAAIEANACGTPVVASNVSGLCDSVRNSVTGYLAEYGDEKEFAKYIVKIIQDKNLRDNMGIEARVWAENFDWQNSSDKFMSIIKRNDFILTGQKNFFLRHHLYKFGESVDAGSFLL